MYKSGHLSSNVLIRIGGLATKFVKAGRSCEGRENSGSLSVKTD